MFLSDSIKREALALGFDVVGIARVFGGSPLPDLLFARLTEWLRRGYHGTMGWLAREPARRADPCTVLPGCRSLVCVGLNYFTEHHADERPGHGRIARYAWGRDYHEVFEDRLAQLEDRIHALAPAAQTRRYVDTGAVMEKAWAQQAGLGWIGKHSNLVSPRFGSWLLLGEILTTLDLSPDEPGTDLCGMCRLCINACPTGAIAEPYVVDARRCISYLTIELHGVEHQVPEDLAEKMDNRIFGCDDCLDVCPYNAQASATRDAAFEPSRMTLAPDLLGLAQMTERGFADTFRHSPIRRPKHAGFLRNVRIALRNVARATGSRTKVEQVGSTP
jgi:epoxyqueuosine reductase